MARPRRPVASEASSPSTVVSVTLFSVAPLALGLALVVAAVVAGFWGVAAAAQTEPSTDRAVDTTPRQELAARGAVTYRVFCRNCHGPEARGDGRLAELLTVEPSDLTGISAANDGTFPFDRVYRIIDGRDMVPGHGSGEMPIWGDAFREGVGPDAEAAIHGKILQLVYYLESIQRDDAGES